MSKRRETVSYSSTADFSEEGGFDQDCFTKAELRHCIEQNYDIENVVLMDNDEGIDCDDAEIRWIKVSIDCIEDRSSVEYTVTAQVEWDEESEWDEEESSFE